MGLAVSENCDTGTESPPPIPRNIALMDLLVTSVFLSESAYNPDEVGLPGFKFHGDLYILVIFCV